MFWSADKKMLWPHLEEPNLYSPRSSGSVFDISVFILTLQNTAVMNNENQLCVLI